MSRIFKFRVWDKKAKIWIYEQSPTWFGGGIGNVGGPKEQPWKCMSFDGKVMSNDNMGGFVDKNQEDYIIQQFTGLTDKNGIEIYEGDIVKTNKDHVSMIFDGWHEYTAGVITWLREAFCVCQKHVGGNEMSNYSHCDCCPCGLEIIGNIYENPELIKE